MTTIITSRANPQVKRLLKIRKSRDRRREGIAIIEGSERIAQAMRAGLTPEAVYCSAPAIEAP